MMGYQCAECGRVIEDHQTDHATRECSRGRVWRLWNGLPDEERSPVHVIAGFLQMTTADVAAIVYPADTFGAWADTQEPTDIDDEDDDEDECEGHESLSGAHMGETVYCDGSCQAGTR